MNLCLKLHFSEVVIDLKDKDSKVKKQHVSKSLVESVLLFKVNTYVSYVSESL